VSMREYNITRRCYNASRLLFLLPFVVMAPPASAQTVEIAPFTGYRFGNDFFELATNRQLDLDGAPVVGGTLNVDLGAGLSVEGVFTRQQAHVAIPVTAVGSPAQVRVVVDQWLAGGRQEFGDGRVRPFLTGLLGLTRYAVEGDNELRFAVSAASGVKVQLERRLGVRLDGRVFTTFVDAEARTGICGPRGCLVGVSVDVVWQLELTAALVVGF
jgi:hypothetical protein